MFGGWYIVAQRGAAGMALVAGPVKDRAALPKTPPDRLSAGLERQGYSLQYLGGYVPAFILTDELHEGALNKELWLTITREPWHTA